MDEGSEEISLHNTDYVVFIDEQKFSRKNGDIDDCFYYFGVIVNRKDLNHLKIVYEELIKHLQKGFHANDVYKAKNADYDVLSAIHELFVSHKLFTICLKYDKHKLLKVTKQYFGHIQPEPPTAPINWGNPEHQAYFYFTQAIGDFFENAYPNMKFGGYADRGTFGRDDIVGHEVTKDKFWIIHVSRKKISLLGLPDHVAYLFRKCRELHHVEALNKILTSKQTNLAQVSFDKLTELEMAKAFKVFDANEWLEQFVERKSAEELK